LRTTRKTLPTADRVPSSFSATSGARRSVLATSYLSQTAGCSSKSSSCCRAASALDVLERGRQRDAEAMLRTATEAYVLDVDSWAHRAHLALHDGRLDDALGFAEAAVGVGERSIPDRFSGVLDWSHFDNRPYLRGRHALLLVLWRLHRFDDAHRVAVDSIWLNPNDNQGIRLVLDQLERRMPWVEARDGA
jgi:tetratricopeptide (TPR) repeat protein